MQRAWKRAQRKGPKAGPGMIRHHVDGNGKGAIRVIPRRQHPKLHGK
jgi:hypothetical protein